MMWHVFALQQSMDECTQEEIKEDYLLQATPQGYLSDGGWGALTKKSVENANIKPTDTETQCWKQHLNRTRIYWHSWNIHPNDCCANFKRKKAALQNDSFFKNLLSYHRKPFFCFCNHKTVVTCRLVYLVRLLWMRRAVPFCQSPSFQSQWPQPNTSKYLYR